jgi:hypothetical protein
MLSKCNMATPFFNIVFDKDNSVQIIHHEINELYIVQVLTPFFATIFKVIVFPGH